MKKGILFAILASVIQLTDLSTASAFGFPTKEKMQENFQTCSKVHPYWHQNWGRYVIAFDVYKAHKVCTQNGALSNCYHKVIGCSSPEGLINAGFYCACR